MRLDTVVIDFNKDDNNREYATVKINDTYVINPKGKLDTNLTNIGSIYPKVDKSNKERSILYRVSLLLDLIQKDKIQIEN